MAEIRESKYREYKGAMAGAISALAIAFSVYHILYVGGILSRLGIFVYNPQHLAIHLGSILALVFWLVPGSKKSHQTLPWYDAILLLIGFGWNMYLIINFDAIYLRTMGGSLLFAEAVTIWIVLLIVLEAARRVVGLPIALIAAAFLLYPLVASYIPGLFSGAEYSWDRVARSVGLFTTGMYGGILNISATIVVSFILFAQFLYVSGAGQWFIDMAQAVLGNVRGGPAKVAVLASSLMGTIQGTGVGNVAATGIFTIPLMKSTGYKPHLAAAIEAVASNGGQIMPPVMGIAAFIMMDFLGVGYDKIIIAGILPAIVYYVAVFFAVDFEAAKAGLIGLPRSQLPPLRKTLIQGWQFMVPLAVLLLFLLYFGYSPQLSALYATVALIVISFFRKGNRVTPRKFFLALKNTAVAMMMVGVVCAMAGIILGSIELTGLSVRLSILLSQVAGGNLALLLVLTAIASIILGMGMPTSAAYILLAILVAPALVKLGMLPITAHFFVFYFGVAAIITPPVCPASYVAAGIAGASPMRTALTAARLGVVAFVVPFVFAYSPALLMQEAPGSIALTTVTTVIMVIALAAGLGGYLLKPLNYWWRLPLIGGAFLILYPSFVTTIIGVVIIAIPVFYQLVSAKLLRSHTR
ncbi:TRAP transporter permease [Chloroflexota bacterium]